MRPSDSVESGDRPASADARRRSVHRSLALRAVAVLVLLVFIVGLGDFRRKRNALSQAERYADALRKRVGDSGIIPLNLDPEAFDELPQRSIRMEALTREDVRKLRERDGAFLIAWTVPIVQVLGRNGRAVVILDGGRHEVAWLTLDEFDVRRAEQRARLQETP